VIVNGTDLTGVGYPTGNAGGVLKVAAGVPLQFSDAAGALKVFCPVPALGTVAKDVVLCSGGASYIGTRVDCPVGKAVTSSGNYGDPDDPKVGTIASSIVNSAGVVTAGAGILDGAGVRYAYGVMEMTTQNYHTKGVLDWDGVYHAYGVLDITGNGSSSGGLLDVDHAYHQFGIVSNGYVFALTGVREADGTLYTLTATDSTPYTTGAAAQHAADAAAVNAELANMTTAVVNLLDAANDGTIDMSTYTLISGVVAAGDVRKGIARYTGGGNGSLVGCVDANGVNQGATGVLEAGSIYSALNLWIEKADVVSEAWVATGHKNYVGGADGEYPTTLVTQTADKNAIEAAVLATNGWDSTIHLPNDIDATAGTAPVYAAGQTNQLLTDIGEVTTHAGSIKDNDAILSVNGAYDFAAAIADGFTAGQADRLETDVSLVAAQAAFIIQGTDFTGGLGVVGSLAVIDVSDAGTGAAAGGELDLDDYVLITSLPDVKYLYHDIDRGDGNKGALRASTLHSGAGAPGVDLAANILKSGKTVDDVSGEYGGGGIDPEDIILPETDAVDRPIEYGYPDNMLEGTGMNITDVQEAIAAALAAANVDSTGGELSLAKAVEAIVAWLGGKCVYDAATGVATYYGRDGETVILTTPLLGGGNRDEPTIS
jgi:hypothetical protein